VVAFGTSSPELILSIEAARLGNPDIALGNVVGSNISNIALVLGFAAVVRPLHVRSELIRREMPLLIAVTTLLTIVLFDGRLSRVEGFVLVVGAVVYMVTSYVAARRGESTAVLAEFDEALMSTRHSIWLDVTMLAAGLIALLAGAALLLKGATAVAASIGISQVVIGLTVVAVGTSMPELATSVTAALRGEADVAFGSVIGSNILNILAVLGTAALIRPFEVDGLRGLDVAIMLGSAVLLLPLMWRGSVLSRWEGAALLTGYVAYMYSLVP
jgi:cation:H+ antiporter